MSGSTCPIPASAFRERTLGRYSIRSSPPNPQARDLGHLHVRLCRRDVPKERRTRRGTSLPSETVWLETARRQGEGRALERATADELSVSAHRFTPPLIRPGKARRTAVDSSGLQ